MKLRSSLTALLALAAAAWAAAAQESAGGRIAYLRLGGQGNNRSLTIRLTDPQSRSDRAAPGVKGALQFHPALSPDGRRLAYAAQSAADPADFDLFTVNTDGNNNRRLVKGAALPAWSPDGTRIAYTLDMIPPSLGIANADGSGVRSLQTRRVFAAAPFWSPDGKRIAFTGSDNPTPRTADLYLLDLETNAVEPLTDGRRLYLGGAGAWSPVGKRLVLFAADPVTKQGELQIWDLEKKSGTRVCELRSAFNHGSPQLPAKNPKALACWSPDGTQLLATMAEGMRNTDIGLYLLSLDGATRKRLTPEKTVCLHGTWSR